MGTIQGTTLKPIPENTIRNNFKQGIINISSTLTRSGSEFGTSAF